MTTPIANAYPTYLRRPLPLFDDTEPNAKALTEWLTLEFPRIESAIPLRATKTVTAAYTVTPSDDMILVDCTAGAVTITLPDPTRANSGTWTVKKIDASANAVTISAVIASTGVAATFDGATSISLTLRYQSVLVRSNGATYNTVGQVFGAAGVVPASLVSSGTFGSAIPDTGIYSFPSQVGIGTAGLSNSSVLAAGNITSNATRANGFAWEGTLIASANGNVLNQFRAAGSFTPGAFTGLLARGLNIGNMSVATFTSPGDPAMINVGTLTGTGATNAYGVVISPPTGATNNYLIAASTVSLFNVTAAGAGTFAGAVTSAGGFLANVAADTAGFTARANGGGDQINLLVRAAGNGTQLNSRNAADSADAPLRIGATTTTLSGALAITGALTGVTTLATSSTINGQTISSAANFTGTVTAASQVNASQFSIVASTSSHPALRGNSVTLEAVLGDQSNYTHFTAQNITALGTLAVTGAVGIGNAANAGSWIYAVSSGTTGNDQRGITLQPTFSSAATVATHGIFVVPFTAAAAFTVANHYGIEIGDIALGAGSAVTTNVALYIDAITAGTTKYAIYTNAGAVRFGDVVTTTSTINGQTISGTASFTGTLAAATALYSPILDSNSSTDLVLKRNTVTALTITAGAISNFAAAVIGSDVVRSTGATYSGSGSAAYCEIQYSTGSGKGTVLAYDPSGAVYKPMQLLGSTVGLYIGGNQVVAIDATGNTSLAGFGGGGGLLAVGGATISTSTALITPAGTTAISSLRVPHGAAPTSPVNGDIWTTTAGIFVRINGSTIGPLT